VLASEPAGADLHVYLDPDRSNAAQIRSELAAAGFAPVEFRPLDPSLEDVFIAAIAQEELRGQRTAA
jgi:predicted nucleic acid-binding protein